MRDDLIAGIANEWAVGWSPSIVSVWLGLTGHRGCNNQKRIHERTDVHRNTALLALIG